MKELAIKRVLDESTRKQAIWMYVDGEVEVFSLHISRSKEVIITDHKDYSKIYSIQSLEFYKMRAKADR